jgi:hypothetical protein
LIRITAPERERERERGRERKKERGRDREAERERQILTSSYLSKDISFKDNLIDLSFLAARYI